MKNYNFGMLGSLDRRQLLKPIFGILSPKMVSMPAKGKVVSYKAPKYSFGPFTLYKGTVGDRRIFAKLDKAKADPSTDGILQINPAQQHVPGTATSSHWTRSGFQDQWHKHQYSITIISPMA
jgi:hypothetical protein